MPSKDISYHREDSSPWRPVLLACGMLSVPLLLTWSYCLVLPHLEADLAEWIAYTGKPVFFILSLAVSVWASRTALRLCGAEGRSATLAALLLGLPLGVGVYWLCLNVLVVGSRWSLGLV